MSNNQPYKNNNKFLISDRALNNILRPVQVRKCNYPYSYVIENLDQQVTVTVDRPWTFAYHLTLDFLGHLLYEQEYKNVIEKRNTWRNDLSLSLLRNVNKLIEDKEREIPEKLRPYIGKFFEYTKYCKLASEIAEHLAKKGRDINESERAEYQKESKYNDKMAGKLREELGVSLIFQLQDLDLRRDNDKKIYTIECGVPQLIERFNIFFKKRRKEYLLNLIKRTSETRFTFQYPIRYPVTKEYQSNGKTERKIVSTRLENILVKNDNIFNYKIHDDKLLIGFNTFLGCAYAHNLLTLNTDWFEEDYLKLDGYASAIYRRFFVTRSGNKFDQLPIKDLVSYFDLLGSSRYPRVIEKAFEDIKKAGLIHDYKFIVNGRKFSKGYVEVIKSSK
jgi:hypothetical protein